ncbi:hypothetical protein LTR53_015355 [Teratosphaeriaceae sp. CCFEE 6253]|nr:hypothetical protein LTR53_015355 [Teratosphaeriaceae sp. CCFEE 6253]
MSPWLRMLEPYLVEQLLRTPAFHRVVEKVAKNVHRVRNGLPPEEAGGTRIDGPEGTPAGFLGHFLKEVRTQLGTVESKRLNGGSGNAGVNLDSRSMGHSGVRSRVEEQAAKVDQASAEGAEAVWAESRGKLEQSATRKVEAESAQDADAVWAESRRRGDVPVKQGIVGEYAEALRAQIRRQGKP